MTTDTLTQGPFLACNSYNKPLRYALWSRPLCGGANRGSRGDGAGAVESTNRETNSCVPVLALLPCWVIVGKWLKYLLFLNCEMRIMMALPWDRGEDDRHQKTHTHTPSSVALYTSLQIQGKEGALAHCQKESPYHRRKTLLLSSQTHNSPFRPEACQNGQEGERGVTGNCPRATSSTSTGGPDDH